jgi:cytochrome c oxidase cbb3-type subunit II
MDKIQKLIEEHVGYLIVFILLVVSMAGLVEILPLTFQKSTTQPVSGVRPYTPVQLAGRDIYIREGCHTCHTQMIRPFRAETERYGHYSVAGESVYDHPFLWGSKRTGPDLARVGARYSNEWHRVHLLNPRDLVPESNMPSFPWLAKNLADAESISTKLKALRLVGVPYTEKEITEAKSQLEGKSEMDVLIDYLQGLGLALKNVR